MMPGDPDEILRARARALAKPAATERDATESALELLVVIVGEERMAIPLSDVAAIARATTLVPLPRAIAPVFGVTAWRGRPLTVLTLVAGTPVLSEGSRFVVLGDARRADVAVLVDAVEDAVRVPRDAFTPAGDTTRGPYTLGVTDDAMHVLDARVLIRGRLAATPDTPIQ